MTQTSHLELFDKRVRCYVYEYFVQQGQAPTVLQCAQALACDVSLVQAALRRLAEGKALVLQNSGEILMAEPFSKIGRAHV